MHLVVSQGRPAPPGRGSVVGRIFLAPRYYGQRAMFASLRALFSFTLSIYSPPVYTYGLVYGFILYGMIVFLVTLRASCGAVYCNRSCLFVGAWVCVSVWVGLSPG